MSKTETASASSLTNPEEVANNQTAEPPNNGTLPSGYPSSTSALETIDVGDSASTISVRTDTPGQAEVGAILDLDQSQSKGPTKATKLGVSFGSLTVGLLLGIFAIVYIHQRSKGTKGNTSEHLSHYDYCNIGTTKPYAAPPGAPESHWDSSDGGAKSSWSPSVFELPENSETCKPASSTELASKNTLKLELDDPSSLWLRIRQRDSPIEIPASTQSSERMFFTSFHQHPPRPLPKEILGDCCIDRAQESPRDEFGEEAVTVKWIQTDGPYEQASEFCSNAAVPSQTCETLEAGVEGEVQQHICSNPLGIRCYKK